MRLSSMLAVTFLLGGTLMARAQAVQGPEAPETAPTFELDKSGKRAHIDFNLKVKPVSDPATSFAKFAGKKSLIMYFSAKCPHCQHDFPFVQKMADSLSKKGFSAMAIAVKFNTDDDIHEFIRNFNARMPILQDDDRSFGENYGTGYVPVLYLVNEKGEYIRYKNFDEDKTPQWIYREAALLSPDKAPAAHPTQKHSGAGKKKS